MSPITRETAANHEVLPVSSVDFVDLFVLFAKFWTVLLPEVIFGPVFLASRLSERAAWYNRSCKANVIAVRLPAGDGFYAKRRNRAGVIKKGPLLEP